MFCSKKESDEATKLKNQDEVKRFYLFSLHVYHLRDLLKCCICLELYNSPVELCNCKHVFCKDCIESYMEYSSIKELACPVCQTHIGNDSADQHKFFEKITNFVRHALEDVNVILGSNLNKLPSYSNICELWEQNKNSSKIFTNIRTSTLLSPLVPDYRSILKAKKVVVEANSKYYSTNEGNEFDSLARLPPENPFFKQNRLVECNKTYANKKRENLNCYVDKVQKFENNVNKKDILHWLEDTRNKFEVLPLTQQQMMEEISDFDLPSISQECFHNESLRNRLQRSKENITPVKQRNRFVKGKCSTKERRRTRSLECHMQVVLHKPKLKRHSLATCHVAEEVVIEQVSSEEDAVGAFSKKAAIVNLMEEKYLDTIDKKILSESKQLLNDSTKVSRRSSLRNSKHENSTDSSRGWDRMKEIKKTIGNTKKKTGKLKVISGNCSINLTNEDNTKSKTNNKKTRKSKNLSTTIFETVEECDIKSYNIEDIKTSFSNNLNKETALQPPQSHCSKTIVKNSEHSVVVEKNTKAITSNTKKLTATNVEKTKKLKHGQINRVKEHPQPHCSKADNLHDKNKTEENVEVHSVLVEKNTKAVSNNNNKPNANRVEKTTNALNSVLEIKNLKYASEPKAPPLAHCSNPTNLKGYDNQSEENEDVHLVPVEKESITIPNELNSVSLNNKSKDYSIHMSKDVIEAVRSEEDPVSENMIEPSQINKNVEMPKFNQVFKNMLMIHGLENDDDTRNFQSGEVVKNLLVGNLQKEENIENIDDSDEVFKLATQDISNLDVQKNALKLPNNFTEKLLFIQNILDNGEDPEETFNKLQQYFTDDAVKVSVVRTLKTVAVQTEIKEDSILFCNVTTQTTLSQHKNVGMQTDSYEHLSGFRISSTDMFQNLPVTNNSAQTDCLSCPNCQFVIFKNDENLSQKTSQATTKTFKKLSLSGSFDNMNFETQEVMKGEEISFKGLKSKSSVSTGYKSTEADNKTLQVVSPTPNQDKNFNSCVTVTNRHKDVKTSNNKTEQVPKNASKEIENFKRIRTTSFDSDLENEQLSQVTKKNKYVNDVFVEFLTESEDDVLRGKSEKLASLNSDRTKGVDNLVKKCDDEGKSDCKHLSRDDIRIEPIPKRLKTQDIIRECEQIIKEACSTTLRIEHTQCAQEVPKSLTLLEEFNQDFKNDLNAEPQNKSVSDTKTKKFSESLFTSADNLKSFDNHSVHNDENLSNHNISKQKVDDLINQFKDIEDSFEEDYNAEVESITESMLEGIEHRIKILQNIVLHNNNEHIEKLDDHCHGNKSVAMFDSDQEIIDTTPQKNRPTNLETVSLLSQVTYNSKTRMKLPFEEEVTDAVLLDPLSCFNKTFTPPIEFQDFIENMEVVNNNDDKEENENVPQLSSSTADLLENEFIYKCNNDNFITSTPFPSTSQVLSSKTLNLSPIHLSTKQMNPILAVQNAAKLPLTITRSKTPQQRMTPLNTSTPKQKSILNYVKPGDNLNASSEKTSLSQLSQISFARMSPVQKKPNVACTRMNKTDLSIIISLFNKNMITFTTSFSSMVTHMIVAVDNRNHLVDHTIKFVCAVAAGIWVVNIKWIEECLKQNKIVSEEPYEALDISGVDGPRQSRLNRCQKPLLNNYLIYAAPPFSSTTEKELEKLIILLGGEVVQRPDDLLHNNGKICLIITESTGSHPDDNIYETWLETLKVVTVDLEWLSRSVGKFEIQSLRPFALCCDASISELGYPSLLLEDVPYSSSHNTIT